MSESESPPKKKIIIQASALEPEPKSDKQKSKEHQEYNYLTEYFHRAGIEPTQTDNQLFVEYWHWLHERFYENSVGIRSTS